jgi:hypothetical protein
VDRINYPEESQRCRIKRKKEERTEKSEQKRLTKAGRMPESKILIEKPFKDNMK